MAQRFLVGAFHLAACAFVCASFAGAQEEGNKGAKAFSDIFNGMLKKRDQDLERLAKDLNKNFDAFDRDWKQASLRMESEVLKGENAYRAATENLERAASAYEATPPSERLLLTRKLYGENLLELAELYARMCEYDKAYDRVMKGWKVQKELHAEFPVTPIILIHGSLIVGKVLHQIDRPNEAAIYLKDGLARLRRMYLQPSDFAGSSLLASFLLADAQIANSTGNHHAARASAEQALGILRKTGSKKHPDVAAALHALAIAHIQNGEAPSAFFPLNEAQQILEDNYRKGHPDLASLYATIAQADLLRGDDKHALDSVNQALLQYDRIFPESKYPRGNPRQIQAMTALGNWLEQNGRKDLALVKLRDAWKKCQRFYAKAHEITLGTLLSYGRVLGSTGDIDQALACFADAESMARELHAKEPAKLKARLASCLHQRGRTEAAAGRIPDALATLQRSLALYQELAPMGHPELAPVARSLGAIYLHTGESAKARQEFERALRTDQQELARYASSAAEAEALEFARPRQASFHGFLKTSAPSGAGADNGYDLVWTAKATVTRLLQERRAATRLAVEKSAAMRKLWENMMDARTQSGRLVCSPYEDAALRDTLLAELLEKKERLERELAKNVPEFRRTQDMRGSRPADLAKKLPKGSVFIDFVHYGESLEEKRYAAFVLAPGGAPTRIDLGSARPIDTAIKTWRHAVETWNRDYTPALEKSWRTYLDAQAGELRRLVWDALPSHFPGDTRLIYLAPDSDLARFPFAALPGRKPGTILLEESMIAYVPHGPFLLDQLVHPAPAADKPGFFLALGAVNYGMATRSGGRFFTSLDHTGAEIRTAQGLAGPREVQMLEIDQATVENARDRLPLAREAHFATHGYFEEKALRASGGLGGRSPLSYVGLALAGANQKASGILTGETIAELPLDKLRLVVLSACETGLGEDTASEGVQGLQRAFHLAGCPNVVATLWQVDDEATRVLMAEFYRQLWTNKQSPLEALHRAQIEVYRHPEMVSASTGRSHEKLWAAFVHSGSALPLSVAPDDPRFIVESETAPAADAEAKKPGFDPNDWTIGGSLVLILLIAVLTLIRQTSRTRAGPPIPEPLGSSK